MKLFIKNRIRKKGENQFFMHQFVEAAISEGIQPVKEFPLPPRGKKIFTSTIQKILPSFSKERCLIVTSQGGQLIENTFPYYSTYKIVPMVWDMWPRSQPAFFRSIKALHCPCVLVSVREMARRIEKELGIPALWVPEGIDITDYSPGKKLHERSVDIYELGRQKHSYHKIIKQLQQEQGIVYCGHEVDENGKLIRLAFDSAQDLLEHLPDMKVIVSFPKVDTASFSEHGGLETLTQRYWEAMLNRSLIIGRAPQELIDFIGYNPVIEVDNNQPKEQIMHILNNIHDYQSFVDENYKVALQMASWKSRMKEIKEFIQSHTRNK